MTTPWRQSSGRILSPNLAAAGRRQASVEGAGGWVVGQIMLIKEEGVEDVAAKILMIGTKGPSLLVAAATMTGGVEGILGGASPAGY